MRLRMQHISPRAVIISAVRLAFGPGGIYAADLKHAVIVVDILIIAFSYSLGIVGQSPVLVEPGLGGIFSALAAILPVGFAQRYLRKHYPPVLVYKA